MPLEPPNLDDRSYEQIRDELLQQIPRFAPEWTDWNESDPGITLIELFATLAESIGWRLNQAPERCMLTFFDVLGIGPKPAEAARADLTFTVQDDPPAGGISVDRGIAVASGVQTDAGPIVFETDREVSLVPFKLATVRVGGPGAFNEVNLYQPPFHPLGADPQVGNALYLGFEPVRADLRFPAEISVLVEPAPGSGFGDAAGPGNARLVWEYRADANSPHWSRLTTNQDDSHGLTRRGYLRFAGPTNSAAVGGVAHDERQLHWLRLRLDQGGYRPGHAPLLSGFRLNTVPATSLRTVGAEIAGQSDGTGDQVFTLRNRPVVRDTVAVTIQTATATEMWRGVRDLIQSGPNDTDFSVDEVRGQIRFGDGRHGRVPVAGADVVVGYRHGGSALANVPGGSITDIQATIVGVKSVTNLRPAAGGRDEETVDEVRSNAASRLHSFDRAVTVEDYRQLALNVGGVADAVAIPLHHPDHPGVAMPGCVTVVVLADVPDTSPPEAPPELIEAVRMKLEPTRVIGTELFVRPARFRELSAQVTIDVDPYGQIGAAVKGVEAAIRAELTPPTRQHTAQASRPSPFGRAFTPTALYRTVQGVTDVLGVAVLAVRVDGVPVASVNEPIRLDPDEILIAGPEQTVEVRPVVDA